MARGHVNLVTEKKNAYSAGSIRLPSLDGEKTKKNETLIILESTFEKNKQYYL